ncbi:GGDEF domain-containing protein [Micromonospora sp. DT233]|uniref:GGDEF domain-containing protein n=1 Tax=Micromonospora sp. DT233 TaxID=3393432 RepID=UPI003CEEAE44
MSQTANSLLTAAGGLLAGLATAGLWALRLRTLLAHARARLGRQDRVIRDAQALVETLRAERDTYHRQAIEDDTTGLPNRRAAMRQLTRATHAHDHVGVIVLDLVGFKLINDRLGHRAGNTLLSQVADRLRRLSRAGVFAARLSGDEFALIVADADIERTATVAERAWKDVSHVPFALDGRQISVVASVGYATTVQGDHGPEALLHRADIAMYWSKSYGGVVYGYTEQMGDIPAGGRPRDWPPRRDR